MRLTLTGALLLSTSGIASAQDFTATSIFEGPTLDCYVTDSGSDTVWRLSDRNLDGDFHDPDEVVAFYDEALGSIALGNNNSVAVARSGVVFISDTSSDLIIALVDLDGDGTAHGPGEHTVFFDGDPSVNLSGIAMESPNAIALDADGRVLVADADNGSGGTDQVLLLEDLNGDGDANDLGEARVYFEPDSFGSVGDVIPNSIDILPDGDLLYLEGGATGIVAKGLYRLSDLNGDGVIDPYSAEFDVYFTPPFLPGNAFMWDFGVAPDGTVYIADSGNDVIWRMRDQNGDGGIDNTAELDMYWVASGSSTIWTVQPTGAGELLVAESQSPDRILVMQDLDGSGSIDQPAETRVVYQDDVSAQDISNPRGLSWRRAPALTAPTRARIGSVVPFGIRGAVGELAVLFGSFAPLSTPISLHEFGLLGLDPSFATVYAVVEVGADGAGRGTLQVPGTPGAVGQVLRLQALVGSIARRSLTARHDMLVR
ncbi:NHL repeat protein [Planctomycetes bacterium Pla163]|uniref:NHL repeat protein n=1 Tax=Rohdeia mirabilis TaxID=2528008 RepID=A0A518D507_9BACT|nr:NHL repeat protein [Planctomycetes bacterium Pla163]